MQKTVLLTTLLSFLVVYSFAQCPTGEVTFQVDIVPDNYPNEISWDLQDDMGNILFQDDISSPNDYTFSDCIPTGGCLTFTIYDSYGDGICCGHGQGSYTVSVDNVEIGTGGDYDDEESVLIACPPGSSCSDSFTAMEGNNMPAPFLNTWYEFVPDSTGMYEINTCLPGNNCGNTTLWV